MAGGDAVGEDASRSVTEHARNLTTSPGEAARIGGEQHVTWQSD